MSLTEILEQLSLEDIENLKLQKLKPDLTKKKQKESKIEV